MRLKERFVNWLFSGIEIDEITVLRIFVRGPNTARLDLLDMDHKTSDYSTESQMWYNSNSHQMKYHNGSEVVPF